MGNRVAKKVFSSLGVLQGITYYIRDAQGNVMSVYTKNPEENLTLTEQHLYGSARLGMHTNDLDMTTTGTFNDEGTNASIRGEKSFELSNHLGNVLSVITDQKPAVLGTTTISNFISEVVSYTDYYPFGAPMDHGSAASDRSWSGYRFGFNGKESYGEISSGNDNYDFGSRVFDSRLVKWFCIDPSHYNYPRTSPYASMLNCPLIYIDKDGQDVYLIIDTGGSYFQQAMATRKAEIESDPNFDKSQDIILVLQVTDLGALEYIVESTLKYVTGVYGETVEVNFFGHCASDGPVGSVATSKNSLSDCTGRDGLEGDQNQLSPSGWQNIDFNFDEDGSLVAFYGCNSAPFAEKFLFYQPDCSFSVGLGGKAGPSYTACGVIERVWWNTSEEDEYAVDVDDDDNIEPRYVYSREKYILDGESLNSEDCEGNSYPARKESFIYGNVTLDKQKSQPKSASGCE